MTINYLDMPLMDFLDTVTYKKNDYCLKINDVEITGTKSEIQDLASELNEELQSKISQQLAGKPEYCSELELTGIEIYNYLEKMTSNFDPLKTKMLLKEIDIYDLTDYSERLYRESYLTYKKEGWEIPLREANFKLKSKGDTTFSLPDYDTMLNRTHTYDRFHIKQLKEILKRKLTTTKEVKRVDTQSGSSGASQLNRQIFQEGGYELFSYLVENYTKDDKFPPTKFSNLYHYMEYAQLMICTQLEYISFVEKEYNVRLTKIMPQTAKYKDKIRSLLNQLNIKFKQPVKS